MGNRLRINNPREPVARLATRPMIINPRRYDGVLGLSVGGYSAQTTLSRNLHHPVYNGRCMRGGACFVGGAGYSGCVR